MRENGGGRGDKTLFNLLQYPRLPYLGTPPGTPKRFQQVPASLEATLDQGSANSVVFGWPTHSERFSHFETTRKEKTRMQTPPLRAR